jgi:hypothetical protein
MKGSPTLKGREDISGSASVMACAPALFLKNGNMF